MRRASRQRHRRVLESAGSAAAPIKPIGFAGRILPRVPTIRAHDVNHGIGRRGPFRGATEDRNLTPACATVDTGEDKLRSAVSHLITLWTWKSPGVGASRH